MIGQAQLQTSVATKSPENDLFPSSQNVPQLTIEADGHSRPWRALMDAWARRELVYFMTLRDLKLRYKQTALGATWTVLQPLITTGVFTLVFGKVAKLDSGSIPYPLFCFSALLPWNYFANTLTRCTLSPIANAHLLNKIYLPRVLIPGASLIPGLVDFFVGLIALLGICLHYHQTIAWSFLWQGPLFLSLLISTVFGLGLFLGALNVRYRDIANVLPFITQLWMLLTPIIYPASLVAGKYRWLYSLNPVAPLINGFRSAVFGSPIAWNQVGYGAGLAAVSLIVGLTVFNRMERRFADML